MNKKELFERALSGDISILEDKRVAVVKDACGATPLHCLAWKERVEILSHKEVAVVKDNQGYTPLHWLTEMGKVRVKYLKKLFPFYQHKKGTKISLKINY